MEVRIIKIEAIPNIKGGTTSTAIYGETTTTLDEKTINQEITAFFKHLRALEQVKAMKSGARDKIEEAHKHSSKN